MIKRDLCTAVTRGGKGMDTPSRMYEFSWDLVGDTVLGRPNIGNIARVEIYRLFQYTLRDVLEQRYGAENADRIFYDAGYLAGKNFCEKIVGPCATLDEFFRRAQQMLEEFHIGILRVEEEDREAGRFTLTIAEDLDCSGLPETGHTVCTYDEGFIAGLFRAYSGRDVVVRETDCWCTGDRTCRFSVRSDDHAAF